MTVIFTSITLTHKRRKNIPGKYRPIVLWTIVRFKMQKYCLHVGELSSQVHLDYIICKMKGSFSQ